MLVSLFIIKTASRPARGRFSRFDVLKQIPKFQFVFVYIYLTVATVIEILLFTVAT